jgi:hypothetical protein
MQDLRAAFANLDQPRKRQVHMTLCNHALQVWEAYTHGHAPIEYTDSVVGLYHLVDIALPRDAFAAAQSHSDHTDIARRYLEPIAALQDQDLGFPARIELAYYAIYNLYQKYIQGAGIDDWLIVNQALSAEEDPAQWRKLLADALHVATSQAPCD